MEWRQRVAIGTNEVTENVQSLQQHILVEILREGGREELMGEGGREGGREKTRKRQLTGLVMASTNLPVIFLAALAATTGGVLENSAITVFKPGTHM